MYTFPYLVHNSIVTRWFHGNEKGKLNFDEESPIQDERIEQVGLALKSLGYKKIRIGVDKGNPQSYRFWTKNNFNVIKENEYILMEKELVTGISKD